MKQIVSVVTGATGHIGNVLIRELIKRGERIRALVLPKDDVNALKGMEVEIVFGDVTDLQSLDRAFFGADKVYHLAGIISIDFGKNKRTQVVNVEGTRNVVEACKRNKVGRLVYTSSVHAMSELPGNQLMCEQSSFSPESVTGNYAKTKAQATQIVLDAALKGLDAVIVQPSGVIGPYDYKNSNLCQFVLDFVGKKLVAYIDGAYNFVDVRDVAGGIYAASVHGKAGECYILSGERVTLPGLFSILESKTGVTAPKRKMPVSFAKLTAPLAELYYKMLRRPPLYTRYSVMVLLSNCNFSHEKASKELGYTPRSIRESLSDTVDWLIAHNKLPLLKKSPSPS